MTNQARGANEWAETYGGMGAAPQVQYTQLPLQILDPWTDARGEGQPFKPYTPDKLRELAENIKQNGVIESICVRPMPGGRFQIVAGHNRVAAAKLAGLTTIPAMVRQLTDDEAELAMVDSNLQHREKLLPSEKAFAYKLKMDALSHQGTSCQIGTKSRSDESIGETTGESARQVQRYIRLTELVKPLLDMVDADRLGLIPAVDLSYLDKETQHLLLRCLDELKCKAPNVAQAAKLKKTFQAGELDESAIEAILVKPKKDAPDTVKLPAARIRSFFPPNITPEAMEAAIYEALLAYRQRLESEVSDADY